MKNKRGGSVNRGEVLRVGLRHEKVKGPFSYYEARSSQYEKALPLVIFSDRK
jgi:hypothetical protein